MLPRFNESHFSLHIQVMLRHFKVAHISVVNNQHMMIKLSVKFKEIQTRRFYATLIKPLRPKNCFGINRNLLLSEEMQPEPWCLCSVSRYLLFSSSRNQGGTVCMKTIMKRQSLCLNEVKCRTIQGFILPYLPT